MAHISGYGGTVTIPAMADLEASLNRWRVHQTQQQFTTFSKGETWKTRFFMQAEWDGEVEFNVPAGVTPAQILLPMATVALKFTYQDTGTDYELTGTANVTDLNFDNPLDGPVTVVAQVKGDGALLSVGVA